MKHLAEELASPEGRMQHLQHLDMVGVGMEMDSATELFNALMQVRRATKVSHE